MMPVLEGKALKEEEFEKLDENIKAEYEQKSEIVQQMIMDAIGEIKSIERESDKKISASRETQERCDWAKKGSVGYLRKPSLSAKSM